MQQQSQSLQMRQSKPMRAGAQAPTECAGIADQLQRAFYGSAWHGPAIMEILADVDAFTAAAKPIANVHSIWELLLHVAVWDAAALTRLSGSKCQPTGDANFPPVMRPMEAAWRKAVSDAKRTHDKLVKTVSGLPDERLRDRVPGKRYNFYHMLHGIAQHELYHAGQMAILKKLRSM
jgi:uncharacterized damage-inducible protein DinB